MVFEIKHISFFYGNKKIINDISIQIEKGKFYGILGPNGSGKTTLLDLLSSHKRPVSGSVVFSGKDLNTYSRKQLAQKIAIVPQNFYINFPFTVSDIVMMGRYPYIPRFARPNPADMEMVETMMRQTEVFELRNRFITELSGGERQRVVFARALVQDTPVLILDESTSNLDIRHTIDLMNLVSEKVNHADGTVIAVFQDINLASVYCDNLIFMKNGSVITHGDKHDVLNSDTIRTVFDVDSKIAFEPFINASQVFFRISQC
jgi:iron complex transport system ATP-binding protein